MTTIAYAMVGLPLMFFFLANIGEIFAEIFRFIYLKVCCLGLCIKKKRRPPTQNPNAAGSGGPLVVDDDDDDDEDKEEEDIMIPMTVTLLVIASYILLGAILFSFWQSGAGWTMFTAGYYCFITISTIGLGDFVPGFTTPDGSQNGVQMAAAAIYLIFGIALMSMGFDLIMFEMGNKMIVNVAKAGDTINELQGRDSPENVRHDNAEVVDHAAHVEESRPTIARPIAGAVGGPPQRPQLGTVSRRTDQPPGYQPAYRAAAPPTGKASYDPFRPMGALPGKSVNKTAVGAEAAPPASAVGKRNASPTSRETTTF